MKHHHPVSSPVRAPINEAETGEICAEVRAARSERIADVLAGKSGIWALAGRQGAINRDFLRLFLHKTAIYFAQVSNGNSPVSLSLTLVLAAARKIRSAFKKALERPQRGNETLEYDIR